MSAYTRELFMCWVCSTLLVAGCSSCVDRSRPDPQQPSNQPAQQATPEEQVKEFPRRIRPAAVAGSWYPSDRDKLAADMDAYLAKAPEIKVTAGDVIALISPHAGYAFSGKAAAAGYKLLRGRRVKRVVILGVAHRAPLEGASIADVTHYETPLGLIPLDREAVARLRRVALHGSAAPR